MGYLNDKITTFMMSCKDEELQALKIENDMVTSFFDSVGRLQDSSLYGFIEELKKDIEVIMQILYNSTNEMVCFFTYLSVMLRQLNPIDHSYTNVVAMCKNLAREINEEVAVADPALTTIT